MGSTFGLLFVGRLGKSAGAALMRQLIAAARAQQDHCMVGGIDIANTASIAIHEKLGFKHAGTIKHAGFRFGRRRDPGFWQWLLETPTNPRDG